MQRHEDLKNNVDYNLSMRESNQACFLQYTTKYHKHDIYCQKNTHSRCTLIEQVGKMPDLWHIDIMQFLLQMIFPSSC